MKIAFPRLDRQFVFTLWIDAKQERNYHMDRGFVLYAPVIIRIYDCE